MSDFCSELSKALSTSLGVTAGISYCHGVGPGLGFGTGEIRNSTSNLEKAAINITDVARLTDCYSFKNNGDRIERRFGPTLSDEFQNFELFWAKLITPLTFRLIPGADPIRNRLGVSENLIRISHLHYSVFLHLESANNKLEISQVDQSSAHRAFEEFYVHLASICDLVDEFLFQVANLSSECRGALSPESSKMSKVEFLESVGKWYDDNYDKNYEHYHKKGKAQSVSVKASKNSLFDYFCLGPDKTGLDKYKQFSIRVRNYRNRIVHDIMVGYLISDQQHLVPKKEKIGSYSQLQDIIDAESDPDTIHRDFAVRNEMMNEDYRKLQRLMNSLWKKPLEDLSQLLYFEQNMVLLQYYNLLPASPTPEVASGHAQESASSSGNP